jgi:hypothetical protein
MGDSQSGGDYQRVQAVRAEVTVNRLGDGR